MAEQTAPATRPKLQLPPLSNPFFFQLMPTVGAGIGVGCGVGIGVGKQVRFGSIPGLNGIDAGISQVAHQLSGVRGVLKKGLAKTGQKHLDAGLGCGVGIGYGFGAGLFLKPGVGEALVDTGKVVLEYGKEQLHAKFGHLLPKEVPQEGATAEHVSGASSADTRADNDSRKADLTASTSVTSSEQVGQTNLNGKLQEAEGTIAGDRENEEQKGRSNSNKKATIKKGTDGLPQADVKLEQKRDAWDSKSQEPSSSKLPQARSKEVERLLLENELLRETLRQRSKLEDLHSEVHALREAWAHQVLFSSSQGATEALAHAHIGDLCFKCQQAVRRRRR